MAYESKKQEETRKYILRKIALDDQEFLSKTMDNFEISCENVKEYIRESIQMGEIITSQKSGCGYELVERIQKLCINLKKENMGEDQIFNMQIAPYLKECNKEAFRIWQYTCEEMLNNVIDHSCGENIYIEVYTNALFSKVVIVDDGIGTFKTLLTYMQNHGWEKPRIEDALLELYKGKITSMEECHSGEGIFFSSKMVDSYVLWSDSPMYVYGSSREAKVIKSHLLAYASRINKIGTMVCMSLENETNRKIKEIFDMYTDVEEGFIRTHIPVKEACINGEPVARSQARRICNRLDQFKEVIFDFSNVEFMGQGFADEVFRVYAVKNPQILLRPINMIPQVRRMIQHIGRGMLAENVKIS